jgi:hypothetical protein
MYPSLQSRLKCNLSGSIELISTLFKWTHLRALTIHFTGLWNPLNERKVWNFEAWWRMDKLDFVTPLPLTRKSNFVIREPSATFPYRSRVLTTRCPNTVQELCNYYKHLCAVDERLTVVTSDIWWLIASTNDASTYTWQARWIRGKKLCRLPNTCVNGMISNILIQTLLVFWGLGFIRCYKVYLSD